MSFFLSPLSGTFFSEHGHPDNWGPVVQNRGCHHSWKTHLFGNQSLGGATSYILILSIYLVPTQSQQNGLNYQATTLLWWCNSQFDCCDYNDDDAAFMFHNAAMQLRWSLLQAITYFIGFDFLQ